MFKAMSPGVQIECRACCTRLFLALRVNWMKRSGLQHSQSRYPPESDSGGQAHSSFIQIYLPQMAAII